MSDRREDSVPNYACKHQQTLDDDREGHSVCIQCGLVLEPIYQESEPFRGQLMRTSAVEGDAAIFLRDIGSHAEISGCIISRSLSYFEKIQQQLENHKPKFKWRELAGYALYEVLSREGASRTKREIGYFTGCPPAKLFDIESALSLEDTLENASDYVARFCIELEMSYAEASQIRAHLTSKHFFDGITAQCGAAAAIYWYCRDNKKNMTLKRICQICDVSPANISKFVKKCSTMK
jgi:transcription initiation factor TFIIIB Brf1 subunit/transcription initiation factor TFIIB